MQKPELTVQQKGSSLVGVMALTLIMSLAAGGFLVFSTNVAKNGLASASDLQLQYAAESGIQLGLRWTRNYPPANVNDITWSTGTVLTQGVAGFEQINGRWVKVTLIYEGVGVHSIQSLAAESIGSPPSVQITQLILNAIPALVADLPMLSTPILSTRTQLAL
jgi:hypothetical protein